ncbi:hypothetical protein DFJ58DRAFT_735261 [Suillus subalutaceus]|uniref:uncharacterized protein n=1 Tax=Suillus subalutaceus TaxID=48586 RepID=UPI001B883C14|nr:uncharacterized protein DFJ58DRAFT_735261 [Suillus subalutaceus]KAG1836046.1 hypothetical protein DFJ58DRAFT_735261 [Suillus subalutaceus]
MLPEVQEAGVIQLPFKVFVVDLDLLQMTSRPPSSSTSSQSQSAVGASHSRDNLQSAMSDGSLDENITTGVHCRRTDSSPDRGDPTVLTPVANDLGVAEEELHEFIDTGGIYYMLIDIKATLLRWNEDTRKIELAQLKELLDSKDFKSRIQSRLTACMLSPNITTYVTDAHTHIMDFVRKHHDVFKIPVAMLEDVELNAQLSKMVSDLLSSIRGNIKAKRILTTAASKRNEGKNIGGKGAEDEDQGKGDLPVDEENSGSESKGRPAVYSLSKFWKFVDDSLDSIRELARARVSEQEGTGGSLTYEHAFRDILVEYFQLDLTEFPGRRTILKLLTTTSPQWQTTIQNQLLW